MMGWRRRLAAGALFLLTLAATPVLADDRALSELLAPLCAGASAERVAAVDRLLDAVETGAAEPAWALRALEAVGGRRLVCAEGGVFITSGTGVIDAVTSAPGLADAVKAQGAFVDLRLRPYLDMGSAVLRLLASPGGPASGAALGELQKRAKIVPPGLIERAAAEPANAALAPGLRDVMAVAALNDPDPALRIAAIGRLAEAPSERNRTLLRDLSGDAALTSDPVVAAALADGITRIERWLTLGQVAASVYSGLSYASILFVAALGLAVIFGLMGVINLAQGELIMIGAYATFLVQEALKSVLPGLVDYYLLLAIPFAFAASGAVGIAMEVTVIRHLYRRPLMTLLATWAISLLLINLVRVTFGTQNLQFNVPPFLNGGTHVFADFIVTWNRLFAIGFALAVLAAALVVLRRTSLGMYIRAVTENRDMAGCVGVSARRIDLTAFGIGSGLAGVAGLALSPIYTVNPAMGVNFIVDAFMVVVLGGVGSIAGTAAAALGVGMINVTIEPMFGAVAAKVIVLLLIIVFIQFRPEGLFAVKGRR
ncbi:urea ABC transporter permease [Skermanella stibiiresistens SB22]|uniref:Urea ABC transporter permease n=1 Tax=Skermanella stibiiresistens SB22 TaxID=1385369 RepID=W9HCM6_9PROT|nr:urea ABC transporter permease subunit UrtB [Skermanella stibiiresistens]EWY41613.1 urea ABC transporter permease [Skermanella stibiiresistens SB22]